MIDEVKGGTPPKPTFLFKLGEKIGWASMKVVRLVIGSIVAVALTIMGLAVAGAIIILLAVIIAVIALFCALIVLCLPLTKFFGYSKAGDVKAVLDEITKNVEAAAKGAASNVHPINPTKRK